MSNVDGRVERLKQLASLLLVIQCTGLLLTVLRDGSSIGSVLFMHVQTGEAWAMGVDRAGAAFVLAIAAASVFGRLTVGLPAVAGWFALIAACHTYDGGAPFSDWSVGAHATRIALPLCALALWRDEGRPGMDRSALGWMLRIAIASTFAIHGMEAISGHPRFIDYLLTADRKLLGLGLLQSDVMPMLYVIGAVDIAAAAAVLTGRDFRVVLAYAAIWGLITAAARVVHMEGRYPATLIRAANGGLPLLLLLARDSLPGIGVGPVPMRRLMRPALAAVGALGVVVLLHSALHSSEASAADIDPTQLRVIWQQQPSTNSIVAWSTLVSGSDHEVYYDTEPHNGDLGAYRFKVGTVRDGEYDDSNAWYHHAALEGLTPATTYYFLAVTDGSVSRELHFDTAPQDDREFRLLYGGDSRSDRSNRRRVNGLIREQVERDGRILAFAHGGDYIADGEQFDQWDGWLNDFEETITADGRILPIIPARGNHEASGALYGQVLAFPGINGDNYYTTQLSPQVSYIVLNSNSSLAGDQRDYLRDQLSARSADTRWLIPSYHRPAYPAVKSPGDALEHWVPLFEQFDVDMVCESDGHVLKRTKPMRDGEEADDGIVYVGEGGLGVDQRTPNGADYLAMSDSAHHIQLLTFRPDRVVYEAITLDDGLADTYTRTPVREGTPSLAQVLRSELLDDGRLRIDFNKPLDLDTTQDVNRYALAPTGSVLDVEESADDSTVIVELSDLVPGTYTVMLDQLLDVDGLAVDGQATFTIPGTPPAEPEVDPNTECPAGSAKETAGQCGCDVPDTDSDGDGSADCLDGCPDDEEKLQPGACGCGQWDEDRDGDGSADCVDGCPDDGSKLTPGLCGCGVAENATCTGSSQPPATGSPADPGTPDGATTSAPSVTGSSCSVRTPASNRSGGYGLVGLWLGLLGLRAVRRRLTGRTPR